ncbi:hypothetical protein ACROYT_G028486 [Oculina patagonica]
MTAPERKRETRSIRESSSKIKMDDSLELLFALESFDDFERIAEELLDENDDTVLFSSIACYMRRSLNRINDYVEITVPAYLPDEFKSHFRMTRGTCELFAQEVMRTGNIPLGNSSGRPAISPEKQVLAFLWIIGNQEPARAVADRFDMTMSSVNRVLNRLSQAAVELSGQYIKWPDANRKQAIRNSFEDEGGFPGIIGLIYGTHIRFRAPEHEPEAYINR